jgi:hypothetical protein
MYWRLTMNHEHKCKLIFALYCAYKLSLVIAYTAIVIYLFNYSIAPLIELHGGLNFIWTIIWTTFSGFIAAFLFFLPLPKRPQATHRDINPDNEPYNHNPDTYTPPFNLGE